MCDGRIVELAKVFETNSVLQEAHDALLEALRWKHQAAQSFDPSRTKRVLPHFVLVVLRQLKDIFYVKASLHRCVAH